MTLIPDAARRASVALLVPLVAVAVTAQAQQPSPQQEKVAAFKQAQAANTAALKKYAWQETTQLALKGDVKSTTTSNCQYGAASGKPACTPAGPPPPQKEEGGRLKERVVEKKTDEMKAYMDSVKTLIGMYVPPSSEKIEAAMKSGNLSITPDPATGNNRFTITNYAQKGDALNITVNPTTHLIQAVNVDTWLNDPSAKVTLAVTYATLPGGASYAAQKVINATAKSITVTVTSSNFATQ